MSEQASDVPSTSGRLGAGARAAARPRSARRELATAGLHLTLLCSLALAQPLFSVLGRHADFFAARGSTRWDIVLFALGVVLLPPLALLAVEALVALVSRRAARELQWLLVAALTGVIAIQALKRDSGLHTSALLLGAGAIGLAVGLLYRRSAAVRSTATLLSGVPVLLVALFLLASPVHELVLGGDGTASADVGAHAPVVMLLFDEFSATSLLDRHGRIDARRYPHFAQLARAGDWFRNATAPGDETSNAVPVILTGQRQSLHKLPVAADYPHNLFTLLGRSYDMDVSEEASNLCPPSLCGNESRGSLPTRLRSLSSDLGLVYLHLIAPPALEVRLAPVNQTWGSFSGNDLIARRARIAHGAHERLVVLHHLGGGGRPGRFERWLATVRPTHRPTLYFKHVLLPHVPFQYLPDGRWYNPRSYDPIPGMTDTPSFGNRWLLEQSYQRHLLQVGLADRMVGELIARLKRTGLWDRALVVVSADNGESFLHRDVNRHVAEPANVEDIASDPLFIKAPHQRAGHVIDHHVRTEDVLPTIAALLHIRLPWPGDGQSVYAPGIPSEVEVEQRDGHVLRLGLREYERRIRGAVARKVALFGDGARGPGLYGIGPDRALVGRRLATLAVGVDPRVHARLDQAAAYRHVELSSDFLPTFVTGAISGQPVARRPVAVAVNGRIAATGWTFSLSSAPGEHFSAMVPPADFTDGRDRIQVLEIEGAGARLRLIGQAG